MARNIYIICSIFFALLSLGLSARVTSPNKVPRNAVLLSKVNSLTVRAGQQTSSRRVSSVPQLQCVGPANICKLYSVDVMRCTNEGSDYDAENIQWSCKSSLPEEFKLGSTDVSCEGYESSEDPYVLKGSCGVEYRLLLTEKGEEKYGKPDDSIWTLPSNKSEDLVGYIFWAVFLTVLLIIIYNIYRASRNDGRRPGGPRRSFGGGGGGGGSDDDPPPPYDSYPYTDAPPKKPRTYTPRTNTGSRASSSRSAGSQAQGWRPGFWTGTAAGAAAGYMYGNRNQARTQPEVQQRPTGGLFGGGGATSSTPSYSSSRHESTGFGSTSRR